MKKKAIKMELMGGVVVGLALISICACQPVNSSELKTTEAADLRVKATVYEYTDSEKVKVEAQMETLASEVSIELDQGENLSAFSQSATGQNEKAYLSYSTLFNFDNTYDGYVDKTIEGGNYFITYKDKNDVETTAEFPTGSVSEIILPEAGAIIAGNNLLVTWNKEEMSGAVSIQTTWSGGGASGISRKYCENTGSCSVDTSHMKGDGEIELRNTDSFTQMPGFGEADIKMINISRRDISFAASMPSKSVAKTLSIGGSKENLVEDIMHQCLHHCEEGETATFVVNEQEYSCCIEE